MTRHRWPIAHVLRIRDVTLNVTYACDLSCVGCNRACFIKPPHSPPMTLDRVRAFYEEVRSLGVRLQRTRIAGGEPTLHPEFPQIVSLAVENSGMVRIYSNQHSQRAQQQVATLGRYDNIRIMGRIAVKRGGSRTFRELTRYVFVDPTDAGISQPHPCKSMFGRVCGLGVDQQGYALCPTAGAIDTLLGLNARATKLSQMLDLDFVEWQARTICSHCGVFVRFRPLPQVWDHNGTPMSLSFHRKLMEG